MNIKPRIFLTSDTHFGHLGMLNFGRKEGFEEEIVKGWNEVVGKQDVVLHLGDFTFVNKDKTKKFTDRLQGIKYLVKGNHDSESDGWYRDCGFTVIPACHWTYRDKYDNWHNFLFTHVPVHPLPEGWYNVHGHMHGSSNHHKAQFPELLRGFDVGVDPMEYKPIQLSKVIDLLLVGDLLSTDGLGDSDQPRGSQTGQDAIRDESKPIDLKVTC